jgi:HemY protein
MGRVREWLTRAVGAQRDPAWIADGVAYERWGPVSPTTGRLDAMHWETPDAGASERAAATALAAKLESMMGLGAADNVTRVVEAPASSEPPAEPVPTPVTATAATAPVAAVPPAKLPPPAQPPVPPPAAPPMPADRPDSVVGDIPTVPAEPVGAARPRPRRPTEPKIFVSPRAPDDPGTGASDLDDLQGYPTKA